MNGNGTELRAALKETERLASAAELAAHSRRPSTAIDRAFHIVENVIEASRTGRDEVVRAFAHALVSTTRALGTVLDRTEAELKGLRSTVDELQSRINGAYALSDDAYRGFEERFRGDYQDVLRRHEIYRPWIDELASRHHGSVVFEIGPGRGEMAKLLKDSGFHWRGVDSNTSSCNGLVAKGYDARTGDGWTLLSEEPDNSLGAIVSLHVVEHVPFHKVRELFTLAQAKLKPGGLLILETPNWSSLTSTFNFYLDPTHLRPVDGRLLEFLAHRESFSVLLCEGVEPPEKLELLPKDVPGAEVHNRNLEKLNRLLMQGQDLAFVARKG